MRIDCRIRDHQKIARMVSRVLVDGKDAGSKVYFADEEQGLVMRYVGSDLIPYQYEKPAPHAFNEGGLWAEKLTGKVEIEFA